MNFHNQYNIHLIIFHNLLKNFLILQSAIYQQYWDPFIYKSIQAILRQDYKYRIQRGLLSINNFAIKIILVLCILQCQNDLKLILSYIYIKKQYFDFNV